jgi:hypothetical protein
MPRSTVSSRSGTSATKSIARSFESGSIAGGNEDDFDDMITDDTKNKTWNGIVEFFSKYKFIIIVLVIGVILLIVFVVYPNISNKGGFTSIFKASETAEEKLMRETNEGLIKQINNHASE